MILYRMSAFMGRNSYSGNTRAVIDRFGKVPHCGEELMWVVSLRRLGKLLGCEKMVMKQGRLTLFFVTQNDSPFYQSEAFDRLLTFAGKNVRRCQLREVNGKRSMVVAEVPTVEAAVQLLAAV